jgi:hypothetical protein
MLSGLKGGLISPGNLSTPIYRRSLASGLKSGMLSSGNLIKNNNKVPEKDPDFDKVQLLLHGNGTNGSTDIIDSSSFSRSIDLLGSPVISTSQSKFSGSSIFFDGSSYLQTPNTGDLVIESRDFTVECFVYLSSYPSEFAVIANSFVSNTSRWTFYFGQNQPNQSGLTLTDGLRNVTQSISSTSLSSLGWDLDTFYYIAAKRVNGIVTITRDGVELASGNIDTNLNHAGNLFIGAYTNNFFFNGYLDEFRITVPVARDISVTPISQFPDN